MRLLGHSNIKMTERCAKLPRYHCQNKQHGEVKRESLFERATPKVKYKAIDIRVLYAREIFTRVLSAAKLLKGMVARDGIEPPTPAFSGRLPNR